MKNKKLVVSILINLLLITTIPITLILQKNKYIPEVNSESESPFVNFDDFQSLLPEVKKHRSERLVDLDTFLEMAEEEDVIILDARSGEMYKSRHLQGAVNLTFADFTQANLAEVIPTKDTKILIYCNNNFLDDPINFATKTVQPDFGSNEQEITLALNIPTYINLYGYGYRNVYELSELISVADPRLEFEGNFGL